MSAQMTVHEHYQRLRKLVKELQKTIKETREEDEKRRKAENHRLKLESEKQKQEVARLKEMESKQNRENIQKMLELRRQFDTLENQEWIKLENLTPHENFQDSSYVLFALNKLQNAGNAASITVSVNAAEVVSIVHAKASELLAKSKSIVKKIISNQ